MKRRRVILGVLAPVGVAVAAAAVAYVATRPPPVRVGMHISEFSDLLGPHCLGLDWSDIRHLEAQGAFNHGSQEKPRKPSAVWIDDHRAVTVVFNADRRVESVRECPSPMRPPAFWQRWRSRLGL